MGGRFGPGRGGLGDAETDAERDCGWSARRFYEIARAEEVTAASSRRPARLRAEAMSDRALRATFRRGNLRLIFTARLGRETEVGQAGP